MDRGNDWQKIKHNKRMREKIGLAEPLIPRIRKRRISVGGRRAVAVTMYLGVGEKTEGGG
jgi:hypothetical protein